MAMVLYAKLMLGNFFVVEVQCGKLSLLSLDLFILV